MWCSRLRSLLMLSLQNDCYFTKNSLSMPRNTPGYQSRLNFVQYLESHVTKAVFFSYDASFTIRNVPTVHTLYINLVILNRILQRRLDFFLVLIFMSFLQLRSVTTCAQWTRPLLCRPQRRWPHYGKKRKKKEPHEVTLNGRRIWWVLIR